jgi:hypothetical protein
MRAWIVAALMTIVAAIVAWRSRSRARALEAAALRGLERLQRSSQDESRARFLAERYREIDAQLEKDLRGEPTDADIDDLEARIASVRRDLH